MAGSPKGAHSQEHGQVRLEKAATLEGCMSFEEGAAGRSTGQARECYEWGPGLRGHWRRVAEKTCREAKQG